MFSVRTTLEKYQMFSVHTTSEKDQMFSVYTTPEEHQMVMWDLCLSKTRAGKYHDYHIIVVFVKFRI